MKKIVCTLFCLFSFSSLASVIEIEDVFINFSNVTPGFCDVQGNSVANSGFSFSQDPSDSTQMFLCRGSIFQRNITPALINPNANSVINLTRATPENLFSLSGFSAGSIATLNSLLNDPVSGSVGLSVVGTLFDDSTVMQEFMFNTVDSFGVEVPDWGAFTLDSAFINLKNIVFTAIGTGETENVSPQFLISEFMLQTQSGVIVVVEEVPAPYALGVLLIGLVGMRRFS